MTFLADENFSGPAVRALREPGCDVAWIIEQGRSSPDPEVLQRGVDADRIVLTLDKDFGALVFDGHYAPPAGIVLFRVDPRENHLVKGLVLNLLDSQHE